MIDVTTQDGVADAYLARPDDPPRAAVLLVMDAYGLRPQIERMADRIASRASWSSRPTSSTGPGPRRWFRSTVSAIRIGSGPLLERVMPLVRGLTPGRIVSDGAYLDRLERLAPGPVAITGYCMGGRSAGVSRRPTLSASRPSAASTSAAL